ncbi:hypothetical protein CBR_g19622 [Chara braunii]|uniref:aspartate--tRNA ligase n=1 Tax=Chara braunii TaxID=69332 RepID=A0A388KYI1_CHABU|nr:hypothetical protein CBR_g19622 [Chara braunii]|eukprot:GBG75109.1 hypothetical protein CBR_g19622 [Chara braunii]
MESASNDVDGVPATEMSAGKEAPSSEPTTGAKKGGGKADRNALKAERLAARMAAASLNSKVVDDPLACNYGDVPMKELQSKEISGKVWTKVGDLEKSLDGKVVLVRGRVHSVRGKGNLGFLVIREAGCTVQAVLTVGEHVSKGMVKYASQLSKESIVDVEGVVTVPNKPIESTSQQVELQVRKVYCVSKAVPALPLNIEDAARSEASFEQEGAQFSRVNQDVRLNNRVLDLRTPANQATFRLQSAVGQLFREFLVEREFVEIHTPKMIAGASEGGASVFTLDYMGQRACLAQSPQLYKQMAICADMGRVFEIGPVFRAEKSNTHRHLCEFTGLDLEMEIKEHYFEVLELLDGMFLHIFNALNTKYKKELDAVNQQFPFEPLQYLQDGCRLTFAEGVELLKEAGIEIDPFDDLSTETERRLGQLVKEKYKTDFYVLHRYPVAARPFYTMPCADDPRYTNSFDIFIRGEEIISGAQRIHDPELLTVKAIEKGMDVKAIASYVDSFRYGAVPHGGAGVGLERVIMLFCDLKNIRKTSMFPRDPSRLTP